MPLILTSAVHDFFVVEGICMGTRLPVDLVTRFSDSRSADDDIDVIAMIKIGYQSSSYPANLIRSKRRTLPLAKVYRLSLPLRDFVDPRISTNSVTSLLFSQMDDFSPYGSHLFRRYFTTTRTSIVRLW